MDTLDLDSLEAATGGRYDIEGFWARGGMGAVFTARNRSLGSRVAIKVLSGDIATHPVRLARFKREAALAANLSHPHIVPVFEFGATSEYAYLVMPFVEGQTLSDRLQKQERLDYEAIRELVQQIGSALGFAHNRGIVHRDVKPANILHEEASGRWLITDFGVARLKDPDDTTITQAGAIIGTPAYMSPEQRMGGDVDGRSDLYSLAAVAYQALTGTPIEELLSEIAHGTPTSDVEKRSLPSFRFPPGATRALTWPLRERPEDRPDTAAEWLRALERVGKPRIPFLYKAFMGAAALIAALAIYFFVVRSSAPAASANRPTVAVIPFRPGVAPQLDSILAPAFDWQLRSVPNHRVLGPTVRREIERRFRRNPPELDSSLSIAHNMGATLALVYRTEATSDRLEIIAGLHDLSSGRRVGEYSSVGPLDSVDSLVSDIVIQTFAQRVAIELSGIEPSLPNGFEAAFAYLEGDRLFRRAAYDRAAQRFDRVIELDSTFAPAYLKRMASIAIGLRPSEATAQTRSALDAASRFRTGLDPVSRRVLLAYEQMFREGDIAAAESTLRATTTDYPNASEAWMWLGWVQFGFRSLLGVPIGEARFAFEQALDRDPEFATVLGQLGFVKLKEGNDDQRARDYLQRYLTIDSVSHWAELARMTDSLVSRDIAMVNAVIGSLGSRPSAALEALAIGGGELRPAPGLTGIAREAIAELWRRATTREELRLSFRMQFAYYRARGWFAASDSLLREAERRRVPRDELDRWIVVSRVSNTPDIADEATARAAIQRLRALGSADAEALWLVSRWNLTHGGSVGTEMTALRRLATDPENPSPHARSLIDDLEARQRLLAGDSTGALDKWGEATRMYAADRLLFGLSESLWPIRFERAMLAAELDDLATAREILTTFDNMAGFVDQVAWAPMLRLRVTMEATDDNVAAARNAYAALTRLLENADGAGVAYRDELVEQLSPLIN